MNSTSLTKPVDLQGLSLALAKTKADYEGQINNLPQSDWEENDNTQKDYILNKPAIVAGEGQYSIIEGRIDPYDDGYSIYTLKVSGDAKAVEYSYTTEDTLPSASSLTLRNYVYYEQAKQYNKIIDINTTNNTVTFFKTLSASAISNATILIHYQDANRAVGNNSHAEGIDNISVGNHSHAEGRASFSGGLYSHAEGYNTITSGASTHAEGQSTKAIGLGSHSEGNNTISSSQYQHVQGKWNIEDAKNTYADIVGNGTSKDTRSNAYTLDWNGNGWYAGKVSAGTVESPANPTAANDLATKQYVDENGGITYTISATNNTITLTGSDSSTSTATLPIYDGTILSTWEGGNF